MEFQLVIKVKYGDTVRRFIAVVSEDDELEYDMKALTVKIISLFNLSSDADLTLTYFDVDGDLVTLVDDDDLHDAIRQCLNPFRINVMVNNNNNNKSRNSTPMESPRVQPTEIIKELFHEAISKLNSEASSLARFFDNLLKNESFLSLFSQLQNLAKQNGTSYKDIDSSKGGYIPEIGGTSTVNILPVDSNVDSKKEKGEAHNTPVGHPPNCPLKTYKNLQKIGAVIHNDIWCNGCGTFPISGPWFKSLINKNYDLCSICFSTIGNSTDYLKMNRPDFFYYPRSSKGIYCPPSTVCTPYFYKDGVKPTRKLDSRFVSDITVIDGTVLTPLTPFSKFWRMRNNGSLVWSQGTQLIWIGGQRFSDAISVEIQVPENGVQTGQELDIAVDFVAPEQPGLYVSYWMMASPSGQKYGQRVWVSIQVGLNLNLPPVSHESNDEYLSNNNLLSNDGVSRPDSPVIISASETTSPPLPAQASSPVTEHVNGSLDLERSLLKELEVIGFKETDLNKEIIRKNHYNFEQSLNDLYGEWNPILEELDKMGFYDRKKNKEMLEKNDGSIRRAVMDLIAGEK